MKESDETLRRTRRFEMRHVPRRPTGWCARKMCPTPLPHHILAAPAKGYDSSLKRHAALKTRLRTFGPDNVESLLKELDTLSLEKYITELTDGFIEGLSKCRNEKDIWAAVQVCAPSQHELAVDTDGIHIDLLRYSQAISRYPSSHHPRAACASKPS